MKDGVDALIYAHPNTYAIPLSNLQPDQSEQDMEECIGGALAGGALGYAAGGIPGALGGAFLGSKAADAMDNYNNSSNQKPQQQTTEANVNVTNNAPDYPSNREYTGDPLQYSGGLNGKKSTGQSTTPVVASQVRRLHSHVSEGQHMMDLYKVIAAIENKEA
jgi:hypothetical protein